MPGTYSKLVTAVTGGTITAAERNNEHDNHITNATPDGIDDASANLAAMQATTDPTGGTLATDLRGEIKGIRYILKTHTGSTNWYDTITAALLKTGGVMTGDITGLGAWKYRRPVLQFGSITTVAVEAGLDGTSGNIPMLFPDGSVRTETSTTRTTFNITRNAVLTTSGAQSGLTGATSEATNTWYALYAVKVTDSSTLWVTVGSTVLPLQANFATLNTAYATNGWVYLGMIRNGNQADATGDIINFRQSGSITEFVAAMSGANWGGGGILNGMSLATTAGATTLTWSSATGTAGAVIPTHINLVHVGLAKDNIVNSVYKLNNDADTISYMQDTALGNRVNHTTWAPHISGLKGLFTQSTGADIYLSGWIDPVLGVGPNPVL